MRTQAFSVWSRRLTALAMSQSKQDYDRPDIGGLIRLISCFEIGFMNHLTVYHVEHIRLSTL
jgi:hypothetical protein